MINRLPVITSRPESATRVLKWMRFPFCHIWISSVCPGMVGLVKRALTALNSETSLSAYAHKTARTERPRVHRPCKIGVLWPANFEKSGSMCNGFKSPDNLESSKQNWHLFRSNRPFWENGILTDRVPLDQWSSHIWWMNRMDDLELVRPVSLHRKLWFCHQNCQPQQWMWIFDFSTVISHSYRTCHLILYENKKNCFSIH